MANDKIPGRAESETPSMNGTGKPVQQARVVPAPAPSNKSDSSKRRDKNKSNTSRVGGTAVPGAKSTQPKQISTSNANQQQQQAESYNRTMRRRMEHLGTGPESGQERTRTLQEKRRKRIAQRKERLEERRAELQKTLPRDRRNLYFLIAVVAVIVLLIVAFILLRAFGVLH